MIVEETIQCDHCGVIADDVQHRGWPDCPDDACDKCHAKREVRRLKNAIRDKKQWLEKTHLLELGEMEVELEKWKEEL